MNEHQKEAIRMLEQEGLAITVPRKGAEVAKMTENEIVDVLNIRLALEKLAADLSCDNINAVELQELHVAMFKFEEAEFFKADEQVKNNIEKFFFYKVFYYKFEKKSILMYNYLLRHFPLFVFYYVFVLY